MKILLLEDDKNRISQFYERVKEFNERNHVKSELIHVETAKDCIEKLENDTFNLILLDHDLGGEVYVSIDNTNTGSEVARWINKNPEKIHGAFVITHTFNPAGANNIKDLLPECIYIPAIWMKDKFHKIIQVV
jgi:DNA-binding LytR/AlgR family response regulator